MTITNKVTLKSLNAGLTPATDVPDAPTIGTATAGLLSASVTFTPAATGGTPTSYTVTSSPGSITGTGSSPVTVSGLTGGTSYTFTVTATNASGTSPASSASNSITPVSPLGYESISTVTTTSAVSSITFSSIPSTFTHLQVRIFSLMESGDNFKMTINNDTASNYSWHQITGDGSSAGAAAGTSTTFMYVGNNNTGSAVIGNVSIIDILDYADTNKYKTVRALHGSDANGSGLIALRSGNWRSTSAITRIDLTPSVNNFKQYSHFALYGVK